MMRSTVWTGLFRGTATLGIGTILWLQQNYTPREKFEDYKVFFGEKLDRLERGQLAIELELRILNRKPPVRDAVALPK